MFWTISELYIIHLENIWEASGRQLENIRKASGKHLRSTWTRWIWEAFEQHSSKHLGQHLREIKEASGKHLGLHKSIGFRNLLKAIIATLSTKMQHVYLIVNFTTCFGG